ncbi:MAG: FkbM family methyltransferase [Sedimentisphaerales bacterium]|nr:FkbM family methyltransferase [Sedimentisphaerales bacterium]
MYKRRLPRRVGGGCIYITSTAALGYLRHNMDDIAGMSDLFDAADMFVRKGDLFWDIGAKIGVFSFVSAFKAGRTGKVVALEPDVMLVEILQKSRDIQDESCAPVAIIPAAVSDSNSLLRLNIAGNGRCANYIETSKGSTQVGEILACNWVCTLTLDSLLEKFDGPDIIKIDVEGAELSVLNGAKKVLAEYQPLIICEVRDFLAIEVSALLRENGYVLYDLENFQAGRIDMAVYNTLAVPHTRCSEIEDIIRGYEKR